jgi:DNA-directed RNA polymerase subunit RPC12/RpoP
LPHLLKENFKHIPAEDIYACSNCGYTLTLQPSAEVGCTNCKGKIWIRAIRKKRID